MKCEDGRYSLKVSTSRKPDYSKVKVHILEEIQWNFCTAARSCKDSSEIRNIFYMKTFF